MGRLHSDYIPGCDPSEPIWRFARFCVRGARAEMAASEIALWIGVVGRPLEEEKDLVGSFFNGTAVLELLLGSNR